MPSPFAGDPTLYPSTYLIPSDVSDDVDAASVNVAFEALGDRTEWLRARTNDIFQYTNTSDSGGFPSSVETFAYVAGAFVKSSPIKVDITGCKAFDQLLCRLHIGAISLVTTASLARLAGFKMYCTDDLGGGSETDANILGSLGQIGAGSFANGTDDYFSYAAQGRHTVSFDGTCRVGFEVANRTNAAGSVVTLFSHVYLEVRRIKF